MYDTSTEKAWERIANIVRGGDAQTLDAYLDTIPPAEIARAISRLDDDERAAVLTLLEPEDAADLIEELSDAQGADLLEELSASQAATIVDEMESDERADVLAELDEEDAEAILGAMRPEEAEEARTLLTYSSDTAGGIMHTEFVAYPDSQHVADVLNDLRANAEVYSDYGVQYVYVLSENETLVGVVRLRDLVLSRGDVPLTSVMIANPHYALTETHLDELEQIFDRHPFVGLPVVDAQGSMVGVVRRADAEEALAERAGRALMQFSGIVGGGELRDMPALARSWRRMTWLAFNLLLSLAAAHVILVYQGTIERVVALAFFIPVIGNMSGCSGNQAVAVSIRELTLGVIKPQDFLRVLWKELQVGFVNGLVLGAVLGGVALLVMGNPYLGLVVGAALGLNTLVALSLGGLIPLVLRSMKLDPALAAPTMVTTLSDLCGFFLVLRLATAVLG